TNASARKLHGAVYNWAAHAWTALPGETMQGEINASGSALRPSIEYQRGDLVVAYYDVSATPDVRVKRLRAGSTTWETLGGTLSPTPPELERLELLTLGDTLWVGWAT